MLAAACLAATGQCAFARGDFQLVNQSPKQVHLHAQFALAICWISR